MQIFLIILAILALISMVGLMKIFEKAGRANWEVWVPLYNAWVWIKIIEKPWWWFVFILMPFLNVFMIFLMIVETAKTFGKNELWEQGLAVLFPFAYLNILGFSDTEIYQTKANRHPYHKTKVREWTDAIIFAVLAASIIRTFIFEAYTIPTPSMEKSLLVGDFLFVSKVNYGPKVPNTPIAFPFVHHTMPLSTTMKSYIEWIKLPFYRFAGFQTIKNNDIVVFNYPDGDTVALNMQEKSYYSLVRQFGWENVNNSDFINPYKNQTFGKIVSRPVDKRENYIKRCIGISGDKLQIIDQQVFINDKMVINKEGNQYQYYILGKERPLTQEELVEFNLSQDDINSYMASLPLSQFSDYHDYIIQNLNRTTCDSAFNLEEQSRLGVIILTEENANKLKNNPQVAKLIKLTFKKGAADRDNDIFPYNPIAYPWNQDNYGPITIPKAGATVILDSINIALYKRIIEVYEGNKLEITGSKILINNAPAKSYTFKMNYYWMMGDNRHNSADSRFWGFVPEDHIVGKATFVWLSLDKDKSLFGGKIRWDKLFRIPK